MAPEGYELIKYQVYNSETWVLKDSEGNIWFPLTDIMKYVFKIKRFNVTRITQQQAKNTKRVYMTTPRKNLVSCTPENQPKDVIILGNLWCIKNIIRTRFKLNQDPEQKGRDMLIEEFARIWNFQVIGFGVLTYRQPNWKAYSLIEQIAIAAEGNTEKWLRCAECERYYPFTTHFYKSGNITCEKCLGRTFKIQSDGAYERIEQLLKEKKRD